MNDSQHSVQSDLNPYTSPGHVESAGKPRSRHGWLRRILISTALVAIGSAATFGWLAWQFRIVAERKYVIAAATPRGAFFGFNDFEMVKLPWHPIWWIRWRWFGDNYYDQIILKKKGKFSVDEVEYTKRVFPEATDFQNQKE